MQMDFQQLVAAAADLSANPHKVPLVADRFPNILDEIDKVLRSPFIHFNPFGSRVGRGTQQYGMLASPHRNKWAICGNRSGKSLSFIYEDVADCNLLQPITLAPSTRFEKPISMITVSDNEELAIRLQREVLVEQVLGTDQQGFMWNFIEDGCIWNEDGGFKEQTLKWANGSRWQFKYSSQKRRSFQMMRLNKVHMDEEQPRDIYSECRARVVDLNGYFAGGFTPISDEKKGIPWLYEHLYVKRAEKNIEFWNWSIYDNPFLSDSARVSYLNELEEDERDVRAYGLFVPMNVRLALPAAALRRMEDLLLEPELVELELGENLQVLCTPSHGGLSDEE